MDRMPYLKLITDYFTVYFKLLGNRRYDPEWIESFIEIKTSNMSFNSDAPLWYYYEPKDFLSNLDAFLRGDEVKESLSLMDNPWLEVEFNRDNSEMIFRNYFDASLTDHLTLYFKRDQVICLDEYIKLYLGLIEKRAPRIQQLYADGVLQGD